MMYYKTGLIFRLRNKRALSLLYPTQYFSMLIFDKHSFFSANDSEVDMAESLDPLEESENDENGKQINDEMICNIQSFSNLEHSNVDMNEFQGNEESPPGSPISGQYFQIFLVYLRRDMQVFKGK